MCGRTNVHAAAQESLGVGDWGVSSYYSSTLFQYIVGPYSSSKRQRNGLYVQNFAEKISAPNIFIIYGFFLLIVLFFENYLAKYWGVNTYFTNPFPTLLTYACSLL